MLDLEVFLEFTWSAQGPKVQQKVQGPWSVGPFCIT